MKFHLLLLLFSDTHRTARDERNEHRKSREYSRATIRKCYLITIISLITKYTYMYIHFSLRNGCDYLNNLGSNRKCNWNAGVVMQKHHLGCVVEARYLLDNTRLFSDFVRFSLFLLPSSLKSDWNPVFISS